MKLRILIAVLLAVVVAELCWFGFALEQDYKAAQERNQYEAGQLQQREQEIAQLQAELDGMVDSARAEIDAKTRQLREQIQALSTQKEDVSAEIETLTAELETLKQEYEALDEKNQYFIEVYNELKEGLEKVKGYISDN